MNAEHPARPDHAHVCAGRAQVGLDLELEARDAAQDPIKRCVLTGQPIVVLGGDAESDRLAECLDQLVEGLSRGKAAWQLGDLGPVASRLAIDLDLEAAR